VRIPTLRAHAEAITMETNEPISKESVLKCLENAPGVEVRDWSEATAKATYHLLIYRLPT